MDVADDVGVPVRRKQKKHFLEEQLVDWPSRGDVSSFSVLPQHDSTIASQSPVFVYMAYMVHML